MMNRAKDFLGGNRPEISLIAIPAKKVMKKGK